MKEKENVCAFERERESMCEFERERVCVMRVSTRESVCVS